MNEPPDYPKLFSIVDKITTLPLKRKGNKWLGQCYLDGRKADRYDKVVVTLTPKSIKILEQGGDVMGIAKWLMVYGGCSSFPQAYKKLRDEENCNLPPAPEVIPIPPRFIPQSVFENRWSKIEEIEDTLRTYLSDIFGREKVIETYKKYAITPNNNKSTCFWYINKNGDICHENCITYQPNGRRDKQKRAFRRFKVGDGYSAKCYFGEHLLSKGGYKKIYLLEGEKSAIIMSLMFPQHLFLATGGMNNLRDINPKWVLLPDYDAYGYWNARYPKQTVKWWESFPDYEVGEKDDIVDYYLNKIEKI